MTLNLTTRASVVCAGLAVAFAATFVADPAFAARKKMDVRAGATTTISSMGVYNTSNCNAAPYPKVWLKQPKNGVLKSFKRRVRVEKGRKCAGKMLNYTFVSYTPKPGFRGDDRGKVVFSFPSHAGATVHSKAYSTTYTFNVK
ncbi:MAG: hypothetical protein AAGF28_03455 [Pseudomonadota bacterium]